MLVDTHTHLNFKVYDDDREEVIKRALKNNIRIINVGVDWQTSQESVELAQKYSGRIFAAVGLHPNSVDEEEFNYEKYKELARNEKVIAIGEIGLDYFRIKDKKLRIKQIEILKKQIELAVELNKPLIIHCRNALKENLLFSEEQAYKDLIEILKDKNYKLKTNFQGVIHSFSGNIEQAEEYQRLGFKIAFNGIITFSRDYDEVILKTPLENILLETDCPFLAPVPYRGKRNEPAYLMEIVKKLAEIKNIKSEEIIKQTSKNAEEVFNI